MISPEEFSAENWKTTPQNIDLFPFHNSLHIAINFRSIVSDAEFTFGERCDGMANGRKRNEHDDELREQR
jgi:hypothetical protein